MNNSRLIREVKKNLPLEATLEEINFESQTILARKVSGEFVTWKFSNFAGEPISFFWGHYFSDDRKAALQDFYERVAKSSTTLQSLL